MAGFRQHRRSGLASARPPAPIIPVKCSMTAIRNTEYSAICDNSKRLGADFPVERRWGLRCPCRRSHQHRLSRLRELRSDGGTARPTRPPTAWRRGVVVRGEQRWGTFWAPDQTRRTPLRTFMSASIHHSAHTRRTRGPDIGATSRKAGNGGGGQDGLCRRLRTRRRLTGGPPGHPTRTCLVLCGGTVERRSVHRNGRRHGGQPTVRLQALGSQGRTATGPAASFAGRTAVPAQAPRSDDDSAEVRVR